MSDYVPNLTLSRIMGDAMKELGPVGFSAEAHEVADKMTKTLSEGDIRESALFFKDYLDSAEVSRRAALHIQDEPLPYVETLKCEPASTDVGDVSYVAPTAQCYIATSAFGTQLHSWQMVSQGKSAIAHEGMIYAAKVMALTAAKAMADPDALKAIRTEHEMNVPEYDCPLPEGVEPKVVK